MSSLLACEPASSVICPLVEQQELYIAVPQPKLENRVERLQKLSDSNIQAAQEGFIVFVEKNIKQISKELRKPAAERLRESIEMQENSVLRAAAVRSIICAIFHEVMIIPIISEFDRKNLRLISMDERYVSRTAQHFMVDGESRTSFELDPNSLCMESLAFCFRFQKMLSGTTKLSKEHIHFLIAHRNEIREDLRTFIADLIIHYEIRQLQDQDLPQSNAFICKFNQSMRFQTDLKSLFEKVCPIASSLINRCNKMNRQQMELFHQSKSLRACLDPTFENSDVYRPLFNLWVKAREQQKALFNEAFKILNEEKAKANSKIKFMQTFFKDPLGIVTDPFSSYSTRIAELLPKLTAPYNFEGDLERAFMSKLPDVEEKEAEEKKSAIIADAVPPQRPVRRKKSSTPREKDLVLNKTEQVFLPPIPSPSVASDEPVLKTRKFPYVYADRVRDWFSESPKQLSSSSYYQLSKIAKQRQWAYHGFPIDVDQFVLTYGIEFVRTHERTGDNEISYCIPGEIYFIEDSKTERGLFTFTINKKNELYHRYFKLISPSEIIHHFLEKTFYNIDFPELNTLEDIQEVPVELPHSTLQVTVNPLTEAVTILDSLHNMRLTLFKLSE